jgi:TetR/AcrR family transcriptional regulator
MQKINQAIKEKGSKTKIFTVASRLFAEKGYNGVSMREISEQTGLSKPTIYYYFGNKEGIYSSLIHASLSHGTSHMKNILEMNISVKQKLVELVKLWFNHSLENPEFAKFILGLFTSKENLPFLNNFIQEAEIRRVEIANLVQEGINKEEFGVSADPDLAAEIFIGTLTHFLWKQINSKEKILSDQLAEDIVELLFKGLNE